MRKCLSRQKPSLEEVASEPTSLVVLPGSHPETLDELKLLLMSNPRPAMCQQSFLPELQQTLADVAQNGLGMA